MKIFYIITAVFLLALMGCSSYYTARQFPSKEKYYKDFNDFAKNKNMKVILINDSSFITNEGTIISSDSLILFFQYQEKVIKRIPQSEIKNIRDIYDANSNHSTTILLKDGEEFSENDIRYLPDSSIIFTMYKIVNFNKSIPLDSVKEVCYNRHWLGIIPGFFAGIPLGGIIVATNIIPAPMDGGNPPLSPDYFGAAIIDIPVGIIIGSIIGWFVGYTYTYEFNP